MEKLIYILDINVNHCEIALNFKKKIVENILLNVYCYGFIANCYLLFDFYYSTLTICLIKYFLFSYVCLY